MLGIVLLMVIFRRIKHGGIIHLGHYRRGKHMQLIELGDHLFRGGTLGSILAKNRRAILGANIIALAIGRCRIVR